eukprot:15471328-Alexandrium_andersonii.AAC.1
MNAHSPRAQTRTTRPAAAKRHKAKNMQHDRHCAQGAAPQHAQAQSSVDTPPGRGGPKANARQTQ